ncbi:MAG: helix-hairpin-helix domain-containing protein [Phycisphaera sp.]|nr:MAG: helix-hairpin-helix domain-containing protein [Phycisphaera sp.]
MNASGPSPQSSRWVAALLISGVGLAGVGYSLATTPTPAPQPVVFVPQQVEPRAGTPTSGAADPIQPAPIGQVQDTLPRPGVEHAPVPKLEAGMALDINTASAEQLQLLPGIGPSRAAAIVEDRASRGPFRTIEDLARVSGIGPVTVENVRPYVRIAP